jgi:hypothetical protein
LNTKNYPSAETSPLAAHQPPDKLPPGLWRKTSPITNKNRMKSDLSSFAVRLRAAMNDPQTGLGMSFPELAMELFKLQFVANPAYRKFCEARRSTPSTVSAWIQIPAAPTTAFKELELSCLAPTERSQVFHSSGTTRQIPSRHFHNAESLAIYETSLWNWFSRHHAVNPEETSFLALTPPPAEAPHSSLVHMFEVIRRKLVPSKLEYHGTADENGDWWLKLPQIVSTLERAQASGKPLFILGTAFSFVHLLDHLAELGRRFQLPQGSRAMETGGYKGRSRQVPKPELHALITRQLGVPSHQILCEYGMSELSSQAYDDPTATARSFSFPPWARAQIISPETGCEVAIGEAGLLRVVDLANVFSVLAIQTDDLAVRCETGFALVGRAATAEPRGCSLMTA